MLMLLPLAALFLTIVYLYRAYHNGHTPAPWRLAILGGATLWGSCIVLITEGLSLFHALTRGAVALSWAAVCVGLGVALFRASRRSQIGATSKTIKRVRHVAPHCVRIFNCPDLSFTERLSLIGLTLISLLTLVIVLVAAPNNWDSLTYHLPRVMHWIQNRTVAFFVTPDARQICFPPWSEYHILQYQILLGGDRLAALPQWLAFVGSCIATSVLAAQLGATRRFQILAAVIAGTLPMGILQATSTQNDLTAGFWLVTGTVFGLALITAPSPQPSPLNGEGAFSSESPPSSPLGGEDQGEGYLSWHISRPTFSMAALFGLATGLALLTKTTAYLFAAPLLLLFALALLFRHKVMGLKALATAGTLALLLNIPLYVRNLELCGHPLGDGRHLGVEMRNRVYGTKTLMSNLARNAGLQFMTPSARVNEFIELGIRFGHKVIHADINDPATTFGSNRYETKWLSTFEDDAANPLHFVLICLFLPLGWFLISGASTRPLFRGGVIALAGGAILFCLVIMWQPFHSRQHVTLFLFGIPLIAVTVASLRFARQWTAGLTVILLLASFPYVLGNEMRPLLFPMTPKRFGATNIFSMPRERQYLTGRPLPETWRAAARQIRERGYRSIGLSVNWFSCEYPLWLVFQELGQPPRLEHVGVTNMPFTCTMEAASQAFTPDAILRFSDLGVIRLQPAPNEMTCNGRRYVRTWTAREPDGPDVGVELYTPELSSIAPHPDPLPQGARE